uniref:Uncharacterized protein n=1 Tax=Physcomitrium patens TaxID=3218 RepID=A0A7I4A0A8_PHYPA
MPPAGSWGITLLLSKAADKFAVACS